MSDDYDDFSDEAEPQESSATTACLSDKDFFACLKAKLSYLTRALDIHEDVAFICLQHFKWDSDSFFDKFLESRDDLLAQVGISPESIHDPQGLRVVEQPSNTTCEVCFEALAPSTGLSLPCGHVYCRSCWTEHIKSCINCSGGVIKCMHEKCPRQIVVRDIVTLCGEEAANKIENIIIARTGSSMKEFRRCTNPKCGLLIFADAIGLCGTATCACGQRICWNCGQSAHAPLDCSLLDKWDAVILSGEKYKWMLRHTKTCGKCKARIEKNGGCNHMTCSVCGYEFCWVCGHEWDTHEGEKYFCGNYQGFDTTGISQNDVKIARHVQGYINHLTVAKSEAKGLDELREHLTTIYRRNPPKGASQEEIAKQIQEIITAKTTARSVLMWSYPHRFFLESDETKLKLFEFVQLLCEKAMDRVCYALEVQKLGYPQRVLQLVRVLDKEIESLLKHVDSYQ